MHDHFDHSSSTSTSAVKPVPTAPSRRQVLNILGAGVLAVGLALVPGMEPAEARKKHGKGKGKKGGKGGGKGNGGGGGGGNTNAPPPPPAASVEEELLELINTYRANNGKGGLTWDDRLGEAAQRHSDDMTDNGFFEHLGSDGSSPHRRMTDAGYPENVFSAETIFQGAPNDPSAQAAFLGWKNSPPHNAIMLDQNYTRIGIGQATNSAGVTRWTGNYGSLPS